MLSRLQSLLIIGSILPSYNDLSALTNRDTLSLLGIFFSVRIFLIEVITSLAVSKSLTNEASYSLTPGIEHTIILSPSFLSSIKCQISSVMKGLKGCMIFKRSLKKPIVALYVVASIGFSYAGLMISRYHPENSSQNSL